MNEVSLWIVIIPIVSEVKYLGVKTDALNWSAHVHLVQEHVGGKLYILHSLDYSSPGLSMLVHGLSSSLMRPVTVLSMLDPFRIPTRRVPRSGMTSHKLRLARCLFFLHAERTIKLSCSGESLLADTRSVMMPAEAAHPVAAGGMVMGLLPGRFVSHPLFQFVLSIVIITHSLAHPAWCSSRAFKSFPLSTIIALRNILPWSNLSFSSQCQFLHQV